MNRTFDSQSTVDESSLSALFAAANAFRGFGIARKYDIGCVGWTLGHRNGAVSKSHMPDRCRGTLANALFKHQMHALGLRAEHLART